MEMNIERIAQQARNGLQATHRRERGCEAFQAAIDFFRLDIGPENLPAGPGQPHQPGPGEPEQHTTYLSK